MHGETLKISVGYYCSFAAFLHFHRRLLFRTKHDVSATKSVYSVN